MDQNGNNIFIILCKCGHLWCLNYIYNYVKYVAHTPSADRH